MAGLGPPAGNHQGVTAQTHLNELSSSSGIGTAGGTPQARQGWAVTGRGLKYFLCTALLQTRQTCSRACRWLDLALSNTSRLLALLLADGRFMRMSTAPLPECRVELSTTTIVGFSTRKEPLALGAAGTTAQRLGSTGRASGVVVIPRLLRYQHPAPPAPQRWVAAATARLLRDLHTSLLLLSQRR